MLGTEILKSDKIIISLNKTDLPAINQVKILWNPVTASELLGSAQPLWKSGTSYLGAYSYLG